MQRLFTLALLLLITTLLPAQQDAYHQALRAQLAAEYGLTGGEWLLPPDEQAIVSSLNTYGALDRTDLTVSGQPFTRSVQLDVAGGGANPWDAGLLRGSHAPLAAGEVGLFTIWLRAEAIPSGERARVFWFAEDAQTFFKEVYAELEIPQTGQWYQYFIPFTAQAGYGAGDLNLGLHLATQAQTLQVAGMNLLNYGAVQDIDALPLQLHNQFYPGWEPDAPWRAAAADRIEAHRKADVGITVYDEAGAPLEGATVRYEMLEHEFGFGSAVATCLINGNPCQNDTYQERLLDLDGQGRRFNTVVNENSLKWRGWEQNWAGTPAQTTAAIQWLAEEGFRVRGHNIIWPGFSYMPDDIEANAGNPAYVRQRVLDHIEAKLGYPGLTDAITDWDVLNEITYNNDLADIFQGQPGYASGREIYTEIIEKSIEMDPDIRLVLNDFVTISSLVGDDLGRRLRYLPGAYPGTARQRRAPARHRLPKPPGRRPVPSRYRIRHPRRLLPALRAGSQDHRIRYGPPHRGSAGGHLPAGFPDHRL